MKNKIIDVTNLTKKYSSKDSLALDHINLTIEQGSIFGLLGPNGAGKSSFINILSGLSKKTAGKVCLLYTSPSPRDAHESRMPSSA